VAKTKEEHLSTARNLAGFTKRSAGFGMHQSIGNSGGIVAGQLYQTRQAPQFTVGHSVSLGGMAMACFCYATCYLIWSSRQARKDRMTQEERDEEDERGVTGDRSWRFTYKW
jgi:hypothetical protein